jgi:hypothetical protein
MVRDNDFEIVKHFNKHLGQRCFVIATGPSLNATNLSILSKEICFGVNNLYESLGKIKVKCRYYAISDPFEWNKIGERVSKIQGTTVFSTQGYGGDHYIKLQTLRSGMMWYGNFSKDIVDGVYAGGNVVTSIVLQVTYYMGFKEVYLLGCDCNYDSDVTKRYFDGKLMSNEEESWIKKFDPINPQFTNDWSRSFASYEVAKKMYESVGRKIVNCTVGGKLEVFERRKLEAVMSGR